MKQLTAQPSSCQSSSAPGTAAVSACVVTTRSSVQLAAIAGPQPRSADSHAASHVDGSITATPALVTPGSDTAARGRSTYTLSRWMCECCDKCAHTTPWCWAMPRTHSTLAPAPATAHSARSASSSDTHTNAPSLRGVSARTATCTAKRQRRRSSARLAAEEDAAAGGTLSGKHAQFDTATVTHKRQRGSELALVKRQMPQQLAASATQSHTHLAAAATSTARQARPRARCGVASSGRCQRRHHQCLHQSRP